MSVVREWQGRADELAKEAYESGEPTGWFDRLYAEGAQGTTSMPWNRDAPHPLLADWAELAGAGRRAVVVGCGLGADAEFLARKGFDVTGFDLSKTAIEQARRRYPRSAVDYRVADLQDLPLTWRGAFDLVVEVFTLQAVPDPPRTDMAASVRSLLAPGGELLMIALRYDGTRAAEEGPPFPLTEAFVQGMATDGMHVIALEQLDGPCWRAGFRG